MAVWKLPFVLKTDTCCTFHHNSLILIDDTLKDEEFELLCAINRYGLRDLHFIYPLILHFYSIICLRTPCKTWFIWIKLSPYSRHFCRTIRPTCPMMRVFFFQRKNGRLSPELWINFDLQVSSWLCPQSGYVYKNHFPSSASQMHACMKRGLYLRMQNNAPSETLMRVRVLSDTRGCTEHFKWTLHP